MSLWYRVENKTTLQAGGLYNRQTLQKKKLYNFICFFLNWTWRPKITDVPSTEHATSKSRTTTRVRWVFSTNQDWKVWFSQTDRWTFSTQAGPVWAHGGQGRYAGSPSSPLKAPPTSKLIFGEVLVYLANYLQMLVQNVGIPIRTFFSPEQTVHNCSSGQMTQNILHNYKTMWFHVTNFTLE